MNWAPFLKLHERNYQGLNNHLLTSGPEGARQSGEVVHRERLGGCCAMMIATPPDPAPFYNYTAVDYVVVLPHVAWWLDMSHDV